ncbi:MAG: hypothetical protein IOC72_04705 [Rhodobacter sp.]|nr:hypothetical protein [Rhodobacter sp.]MCA3515178.1 hypothetical protein [Rhodobacter sp.]MCA3524256.1 hypothetical protein [Rhodobacter sp.]MCA3527288.1 hypothetical protein [Rhodobacter sp.]MCA3529369.1 hypothetical protein [Rhodobacter sp.]
MPASPEIRIDGTRASITNGRIRAELKVVPRHGADQPKEVVIRYVDTVTGQELLAETRSHFAGPGPRAFKPIASGSFQLEATFAACYGERLMGLGQPQHGRLDLKGALTALVHLNCHVVIPFVISSRGFGFLWNNPVVGRCDFATNITLWRADATPGLDCCICAGDRPAAFLARYLDATGRPPILPGWATGVWQCKLRYRTQAELLEVARQHKQPGLPLSCIVIDFFAWIRVGEWKFDPKDWPDPEGLIRDLSDMEVETMFSIWPTVGLNAETSKEMREAGMILRTERGVPAVNMFPDKDPYGLHFLTCYDAFNPAARACLWPRVKEGYLKRGFRNVWLDSCEPEIRPANAETICTCLGNGAEMLSAYSRLHADRYAQGLQEERMTDAVLLTRPNWAGGRRPRSSCGRAMSGRPGRTFATRSPPAATPRPAASAGGKPASTASTKATGATLPSSSFFSAGSNSGSSRPSAACTASASGMACPLRRRGNPSVTVRATCSFSSPKPGATTKSGAVAPMCWRPPVTFWPCASACAPTWLCCTNPVRDSSGESSVVAGLHEQTHTPDLQNQELAGL